VVFGVDESDEVVQTLDNVRPRTVADVLSTVDMFRVAPDDEPAPALWRAKVTKAAQRCISQLWERTGSMDDPWNPHFNLQEAMSFINRHPRIADAVRHIVAEDGSKGISKFLNHGDSAALLYLMGTCTSDPDTYRPTWETQPEENRLDFSMWDKACEFFTLLGSNSAEFKAVREAINRLTNPDTAAKATTDERMGVIAKAWMMFANGEPFNNSVPVDPALKLKYKIEDGVSVLNEWPTVGGIDLGKDGGHRAKPDKVVLTPGAAPVTPSQQVQDTGDEPAEGDDEADAVEDDVTPEELEAQKAIVKKEGLEAMLEKNQPAAPPAPAGKKATPKPKGKAPAAAPVPQPAAEEEQADVVEEAPPAVNGKAKPASKTKFQFSEEDKKILDQVKAVAGKAKPVDGSPVKPTGKPPTAAESLAKQKAADAEKAKAKKAATAAAPPAPAPTAPAKPKPGPKPKAAAAKK
jgi:hypothetical protein